MKPASHFLNDGFCILKVYYSDMRTIRNNTIKKEINLDRHDQGLFGSNWRRHSRNKQPEIYFHKDRAFQNIHISVYKNGDFHATELFRGRRLYYGFVHGHFIDQAGEFAERLFFLFKKNILNSSLRLDRMPEFSKNNTKTKIKRVDQRTNRKAKRHFENTYRRKRMQALKQQKEHADFKNCEKKNKNKALRTRESEGFMVGRPYKEIECISLYQRIMKVNEQRIKRTKKFENFSKKCCQTKVEE